MDTITYERMATPAWPPEHRHGQRAADLVFVAQAIAAAAVAIAVKINAWDAGHTDDLDLGNLRHRLGVLQWHLANLARLTGASLTEIMIDSVADLEARHGTKDPGAWYAAEKSAAPRHDTPSAVEEPETVIPLDSGWTWTPGDISARSIRLVCRGTDGDYTP